MWQLHSLTGKQQWADLAQEWQAPLANQQRAWISQLDYGKGALTCQLYRNICIYMSSTNGPC